MLLKSALFLFISLSCGAVPAFANPLTPEVESAIKEDLQQNFADRLTTASLTSPDETVLSPRDERVMLKALYVGVEGPLSLAGVQINEQKFNREVGRVLMAASRYGVLPNAITIGYYSRAQLIVGKTTGAEFNFYLKDGKLRVSSYDLKALNVGVSAMLKVGFYVSLCFGSCTGGAVNGSYVGMDVDAIFGAGSNFYLEVGVDTTDAIDAFKNHKSYSFSDFYSGKAIYIGTGIDVGIGIGASAFYQSYTMTSDLVLADLYHMIDQPNFDRKMKFAFDRANLFRSAPRLP